MMGAPAPLFGMTILQKYGLLCDQMTRLQEVEQPRRWVNDHDAG